MLWKSVTALIVLFWAVMTVLLVRQTYFPEESSFTQVSANTVMERAAQHRYLTRNTLTLSYNGERMGHADVSVNERRDPQTSERTAFGWQAGGLIEGKAWGADHSSAVWRFDADVDEKQNWQRMTIAVRVAGTDTNLLVNWKKGDDLPVIEVKRSGELIMDTKQALDQARKQQGGGAGAGGLLSLMPGLMSKQTISLEHILLMQAHKGTMKLAGDERKCFLLAMSVMGFYQAKFYYTEAGELARIELPKGWQLIDPLLMGINAASK